MSITHDGGIGQIFGDWEAVATFAKYVDEGISEMATGMVDFFKEGVNFADDHAHDVYETVSPTSPALAEALAVINWPVAYVSYIPGRSLEDAGTAIGVGSGMIIASCNGEERALGAAAVLGGLGVAAGLMASGFAPKGPITPKSIPIDTTINIGGGGAMGAPAMALSAQTVAVVDAPAIAAEGSAVLAGILNRPTVMYAEGETDNTSKAKLINERAAELKLKQTVDKAFRKVEEIYMERLRDPDKNVGNKLLLPGVDNGYTTLHLFDVEIAMHIVLWREFFGNDMYIFKKPTSIDINGVDWACKSSEIHFLRYDWGGPTLPHMETLNFIVQTLNEQFAKENIPLTINLVW